MRTLRLCLLSLLALGVSACASGVESGDVGISEGQGTGTVDESPEMDDCGNGQVDEGEICDTAIPVPQEGCCAFLEFCVDEDPCTVDKLVNDGTCLADCDFNEEVAPSGSVQDSCCPTGATSASDADCDDACGNGQVDEGESCDPSVAESCPTTCPDDDDPCTNANLVTADPCNPVCEQIEIIILESGDGCCPDGGTQSEDSDCPPAAGVCGDGNVDAGEECDDGNTADGDGCSANCTTEATPACGDGNVDAGEECDDGNTADGDGCSANCTVEVAPACGDGNVDAGEECDDGNTADGDGCSANCTIEPPPPVCGDGNIDDGEECDDGNTADGDGCSANCTIEADPTIAAGSGSTTWSANTSPEGSNGGPLSTADGCSVFVTALNTTIFLQVDITLDVTSDGANGVTAGWTIDATHFLLPTLGAAAELAALTTQAVVTGASGGPIPSTLAPAAAGMLIGAFTTGTTLTVTTPSGITEGSATLTPTGSSVNVNWDGNFTLDLTLGGNPLVTVDQQVCAFAAGGGVDFAVN